MISEQQSEKIEALENLLAAIKEKTAAIASQTRFLKGFNKKMEILLLCFKAYSFEEDGKCSKNVVKKDMSKNKIGVLPVESIVGPAQSPVAIKKSKVESLVVENSGNNEASGGLVSSSAIGSAVTRLFGTNPVAKSLANNILELVSARDSITLDDLVKGIKYSKYKVIEIINALIKERIVLKSFEKGFVYRISKEFS